MVDGERLTNSCKTVCFVRFTRDIGPTRRWLPIRSMVAHAKPDDFVVRALGLTSQAMRAIISGALGQPGKWISSPDKTTAGALEFHVGDEGALASLEARTGWNIRWLDSLAEVRLPALNEIRAKSAREDVTDYPDEEKRVWSDERQRFEDIDGGEQCFLGLNN